MRLDNRELHELLTEKGVTHFHHANTVATSITFIENDGLLSRGDVASNGLFQTPQASDEEDIRFDVWGDVFIDTVDLHGLFPRQNLYGPVLFKFNLEFLLNEDLHIWVTKNNPMFWNVNLTQEDKYFQSVDELRERWDEFDTQRKMVTIRKPQRPVLFQYLEEIVIDNPQVTIRDNISLRRESQNALYLATEQHPQLRNLIRVRECGHCYCTQNYLKDIPVAELARLFLPRNHSYFG
ncbi:hypothetical protein [Vibrio cholerae]|uniref:hypothetical protein n=1 Tax=Vibrio cholerae TaxID=666 RepID=UPI00089381F2|nr:hypothetical protein [Vibrio cholerae]OFI67504.1 hypothetical protein BFX15_18935 [Vibrio cholerae]OFI67864.1 hypothetical protein BFX16_14745 [Vibrio cholerae]